MSLSPFRNQITSSKNTPKRESRDNSIYYKIAHKNNENFHTRSENDKDHILKVNKVKYLRTQQQLLDKFNSVLRNEDSRFIYIIPEGSDISSEDLVVTRINLTDYVNILLPKDNSMMTNSKFKRMGPYEKLEAIKPSKALQNQIFKSILNILEDSWEKYASNNNYIDQREKTRINKDDMFNYLFTVDGRRISSIFDISKINRVLIAGKEKYNIVPLKGYVTDNEETKEAEEKGVVNAVKQACAQWFEQNSIPLDDEFKDVKLARKTAKMHQFSNSKERDNMIDSEMNNSNKASPYANKRINIQEALQNEDILEKVIEMTIQKKQKIKQDKEFYNSLKSNKNQNELDHYCYMNKGVNLPGSQFNVKKARFISLKGVNDQNEEVEKPLFEDSAVSNAIKDPQNKLFAKSSNNVDAKTNANLSKSFRNQNNLMNKSNITNKSGVKPGGKEKESTLDIVKSV